MTTTDYYKHARSLGAFSAAQCLRLAKEAAALDKAAAQRQAAHCGADAVCVETMPDGSAPVRLSFSIKCY